jgi:hypothetical protein
MLTLQKIKEVQKSNKLRSIVMQIFASSPPIQNKLPLSNTFIVQLADEILKQVPDGLLNRIEDAMLEAEDIYIEHTESLVYQRILSESEDEEKYDFYANPGLTVTKAEAEEAMLKVVEYIYGGVK